MSPAFAISGDNERIKAVYGDYNLWSWLKYWYIDSANLVNMLLVDKGYYDYDHEKVERPVLVSETKKSKAEVNDILRKFGLPVNEAEAEADLQDFVIKEEQSKAKQHGSQHTSHSGH